MIELHIIRVGGESPNYTRKPETPVLINPAHITSVRASTSRWGRLEVSGTEVEYFGDAGYNTRKSFVRETYDEVKALIAAQQPTPAANAEPGH